MSSKTIFPDHWHGKDAESEGTGIPPRVSPVEAGGRIRLGCKVVVLLCMGVTGVAHRTLFLLEG